MSSTQVQSGSVMLSVSMALFRHLLFVSFLCLSVEGKPAHVLYMSEDGKYELPGFFRKTVTDMVLKNYTVCAWLKLDNIRQTNSPVIVYSEPETIVSRSLSFYRLEYDTSIRTASYHWATGKGFGFDKGYDFDWILDKWFHFCHLTEFHPSINETYGQTTTQIYIDGEVVLKGMYLPMSFKKTLSCIISFELAF